MFVITFQKLHFKISTWKFYSVFYLDVENKNFD